MGNAGLDLDPFVAACKAFPSIDLHSVLTLLCFEYALVVMLHPSWWSRLFSRWLASVLSRRRRKTGQAQVRIIPGHRWLCPEYLSA
jgi:hypothetical protein